MASNVDSLATLSNVCMWVHDRRVQRSSKSKTRGKKKKKGEREMNRI